MPITDGHTSTSHTTATQVSKPEQATEPWSIYEFHKLKNVNLSIHSLGIKAIAVWINTNHSTSHSTKSWN